MTTEEKEQFENGVRAYLEENYTPDVNEKHLFKVFIPNESEEKEEKKESIKRVFDDFNSASLKYSGKRNGCTRITKITPALQKLIQDNKLDFDDERNIVKLTKRNSDIIEDLINKDENYYPFARTLYSYFISLYGIEGFKENKEKSLFAVLREIDRDNSTNVWRYKHRSNFNSCVEYISNPENHFFVRLEGGDPALPDEIVNSCGTPLKSLSSKICKYLSEWMYPKKDNYFINDSFVRHVLPFYLDYYGVEKKDNKGNTIKGSTDIDKLGYESLFDLLRRLNDVAAKENNGVKLSKSRLDHILWYCYKSFKL